MSPHKHFLNILKYFAIVAIGFSFAHGENVMAASSNALTVPSETTVNVAADQDSGANIEGSLIIAESTCAAGYTVSVSGGTDNNLYLNGDSTSEYIAPSTGTRLAPTTIIGEGKLNTWGISMSETIDVHSNTFFGLTNEIVPIFSKDSASADGGDQINVRYGASVSADKRAGLYKMSEGNTITYYLTTPVSCHSITIVYDGNGADDGNDMAVQHENVNLGDSLDLYASNYKRAGYGFAGWSTEQLDPNSATFANDLASAVSDGLVFGPNETITVNEDIMAYANPETNLLPLYAVWIRSAGNIQDWAGCNAMQEGDVTALTDTRDNNVYAVAKLADDNCWMIENLRLGTSGSNDGSKAQGFGGRFRGLADSENENFAEVTTANSLYSLWSDIIGDHVAFRFPRYNGNNTENTVSSMTNADQNVFSYGNYYTWSAAVANTSVVERGEPETSICPAGWTLPHGGVNGNDGATGSLKGGFSYLDYQLGGTGADQRTVEASNRWRKYPNNYLYSGRISDNTIIDRNSYGGYWSSTTYHDGGGEIWGESSFRVSIGNSRVRPSLNDDRYFGFTVRCLVANYYTVSFDANGGNGTMDSQKIDNGVATNLSNNTFTAPTNLAFGGWNTKADGSGTSYADGASVIDLGNITLYAQWICPPNSICYDDNGANSPTRMGNQSIYAGATTVTLWASNFQRAGYGFAGWNTKADGTGTNYGPNESITFSAERYATSGLKLYAKWVASAGSIQKWNGCSDMNVGDVTALTDQRDNNTYAVAKLVDGNCWMIENLRLDNDSANPNWGSAGLSQGFGGVFTGLANSETANTFGSTTANSLYSTANITGSNQVYRFPRYNNQNTDSAVDSMTSNANSVYSYGNYYTWAAAIADTGDYSSGGDHNTTSICPAGWQIPLGGISTGNINQGVSDAANRVPSFSYLDRKMGGTGTNQASTAASLRWRKYPNNYLYSGYVNTGSVSVYGRGGYGQYWSSTAHASNKERSYIFKIYVGPDTINTDTPDFKSNGLSVRCVIKN